LERVQSCDGPQLFPDQRAAIDNCLRLTDSAVLFHQNSIEYYDEITN
jgi:hypothetical protein